VSDVINLLWMYSVPTLKYWLPLLTAFSNVRPNSNFSETSIHPSRNYRLPCCIVRIVQPLTNSHKDSVHRSLKCRLMPSSFRILGPDPKSSWNDRLRSKVTKVNVFEVYSSGNQPALEKCHYIVVMLLCRGQASASGGCGKSGRLKDG
jgi:hypothetical protein